MVVCEQHPRGVAGVGVLEAFGPAFGVEFEGHGWFFGSVALSRKSRKALFFHAFTIVKTRC